MPTRTGSCLLVPSGWQSLARARAVRRRKRLRWRCVASARSDIRRPPVGQPLALFFTIALPFAGTDVASEAANEPRLGGQLRASHPAAWRGARVEALTDEARRVEPSAEAQRRKRARVSGRSRSCLASSLWSSVRSEPSPGRITAGGARAARAVRVVTGHRWLSQPQPSRDFARTVGSSGRACARSIF